MEAHCSGSSQASLRVNSRANIVMSIYGMHQPITDVADSRPLMHFAKAAQY